MKWSCAEVEALPADMRARLARIANLIEEMGLERMLANRTSSISRAVCGKCGSRVAAGFRGHCMWRPLARRVVIVRVFVKKTEKTPRREIDLALARAKAVQ
jgi:phage-related protein